MTNINRGRLARALAKAGVVAEADVDRVETEQRIKRKARLQHQRNIQRAIDITLKWCKRAPAADIERVFSNIEKPNFREAIEKWVYSVEQAPKDRKLELIEQGWNDIVREYEPSLKRRLRLS